MNTQPHRSFVPRLLMLAVRVILVMIIETCIVASASSRNEQSTQWYSLDYHAQTYNGLGGLTTDSAASQTTNTTLRCNIAVQADSVLGRCIVAIRDVHLRFAVNNTEQHNFAERICAEMRSVVVVHVNDDGAIDTIVVPSTMSNDTRSLLSSALGALSGGTRLQSADTVQRSRSFNDRLGSYRSHELLSHNDHDIIIRAVRRGYLLPQFTPSWHMDYIRQNNTMSGVSYSAFDQTQRQLRLRMVRDTQVIRFAAQVMMRSYSEWSLKAHTKQSRTAPLSASYRCAMQIITVPESYSDSLTQVQAMRQVLGSSTTAGLMDTLRRLPSLDSNTREGIEPTLRAALYLHPSLNDSLENLLSSIDLDDPRCTLVASVLCFVPHAESHRLMLSLLQRVQTHPELHAQLIPYLAEIRDPDDSIVQRILRTMHDDSSSFVRSTAALCLGSMIRAQLALHPDLADTLYDDLSAARAELRTSLYISCLGNAGHPRSIDSVLKYIDSDDQEYRENAVKALRFVSGAEVDRRLSDLLTANDSSLRQPALSAIQFRRPSRDLVDGLCVVVMAGKDSTTSRTAIHILQRWTYDMPCVDEQSCVQFWIANSLTAHHARAEQQELFDSLLLVH